VMGGLRDRPGFAGPPCDPSFVLACAEIP